MSFDLANLLKTIGPSAAIIFAAWIFMGFLQQRYDAAVDRYRAIIDVPDLTDSSSKKRAAIKRQIG